MKKLFASVVCALLTVIALAQNPVVQTWYTGDPAPMSYGDRMYLYVDHDEDKADFFWMHEWRVYSSSDMISLGSEVKQIEQTVEDPKLFNFDWWQFEAKKD